MFKKILAATLFASVATSSFAFADQINAFEFTKLYYSRLTTFASSTNQTELLSNQLEYGLYFVSESNSADDEYVVNSLEAALEFSTSDFMLDSVLAVVRSKDWSIKEVANNILYTTFVISSLEYGSEYGVDGGSLYDDPILSASELYYEQINDYVSAYASGTADFSEETLVYSGNYKYYLLSSQIENADGSVSDTLFMVARY